ncbi:unnamed protein product [Anisakis simplex]|uniref:Uncharacterized protein n=1 Tax=Anisakis simplex TaxID=6269 RepID=A0A3P6SF58_ANISI|nr:unnamed protein product [Anisakis simplex]
MVVPGGEYAENADEGVAVKSRRDNEAVGAAVYSDERQDNEREI